MFTQCPDCRESFRVTAAVLQQAAGRVRCGRCGHAFNALERLSETAPGAGGRSLLDDFDSLSATDNVHIEDTGVEWQVVEDERPANADPQEFLELVNKPETAEERYDDNTPLPEVLDDDVARAPEPPRRRAEDFMQARAPEFDERQVDLALSEPEDWTDLLAEVGDDGTPAEAELGKFILVDDDEPALEVEAQPALGVEEEVPLELEAEPPLELETEPSLELEAERALELEGEASVELDEEPSLDPHEEQPLELEEQTAAEPEAESPVETHDEPVEAVEESPLDADEQRAFDGGNGDHYVPPLTEDEITINRLIDQDLLRLSLEQQDPAATTAERELSEETPTHVETIIMEGAVVRSSLEADEPETAAETVADSEDVTEEILDLRDTYVRTRGNARGGRRADGAARYAAAAGIAALGLLLFAQVVHAYRETLATYGFVGESLISLYETAGAPITPDWNVNGWQFQETRSSTDAADNVLTISTTLANASEQALPYPLLHVELTDRYEEVIASQLLEAGQYLEIRAAGGRIAPGGKLKANVTIAPLSPQAAGFKLNVCYPSSAGEVRCATGAFKER